MKRSNHFEQYLAWFSCSKNALPYQYGGATQCGRINAHNNNQDAIALLAREKYVVGIVCDGCSSSSQGYSNAEVGARLLATLATDAVDALLQNSDVACLAGSLLKLETDIYERLETMLTALSCEKTRDIAIDTFFLATLVCFVVDDSSYAIFGCGDGIYAIDDKVTSLHEYEGEYLAGRLLSGSDWRKRVSDGESALALHRVGPVAEVRSLMVGTDGFEDLTSRFSNLLGSFFTEPTEGCLESGFCLPMGADFRRRVWHVEEVSRWALDQDAHDDRSFVLLRRLGNAPTFTHGRQSATLGHNEGEGKS